jgi:hypothetical protein
LRSESTSLYCVSHDIAVTTRQPCF